MHRLNRPPRPRPAAVGRKRMDEDTARVPPRLSFIMPAHNEEDVIEETVRRCLAVIEGQGLSGEVIVANDGSTDGTGAIMDRLAAELEPVRVVHLPVNGGYGVAMRRALDQSTGDYVATIDSDGQFDPADAIELLRAAEQGYVCVTGYRGKKKDSLFRVIGNDVFNLLVRLLCRVRFRDSQCAVKVADGDTLRGLPLESKGYMLPTEIVFKMHYAGHRVGEREVSHFARAGGQSSLKFLKTSLDMLYFLLYMRIKLLLVRRKLIEHL
jgi:glycosyltransferase involved in cell wall biosynthesis